ncbi:MAG TPA: alpha-amylase family glycosyl hydrolase [Gaiellaceae bacterium]|nr:alpha-amylase family glycosyl hydrolase [Gaiellaceae bacterium]
MPDPWWQRALIYQVYPRSYADSNGDGIGDLPGLISRLDHLEWLGVDAVWLSPTFPSPNADWGYDVADYLGVHPDLGTLADLERLIVEAERRHIRVLLDLVPNHTSDRHPWFSDPAKRDWYVWRDPKPDGSPPSNWRGPFGLPSWTFVPEQGRYYLHNFLPQQPDLDWWNEEVRAAFDEILRYWFDRGVAGFRIDVPHALVVDLELRDNPPARPHEAPVWARVGQWPKYTFGLPEGVDVHRRWRRIAGEYDPERLLLGETYVLELDLLMQYVVPDGLQLCMNLPFLHAPFRAEKLAGVVAETERRLPASATPVWHASSHDDPRFATRWCAGDEELTKCTLVGLLSLRGAAILYQGDEIGLETVDVPQERRRDPVGRDGCRTPMVWRDEDGAGFTSPGVEPWLPIGSRGRNVADQRGDPGSILTLTRDLIALRRHRGLLTGEYEQLDAPAGVWAFRRGGGALVALNLGESPARLDDVEGAIVLCTDRARDGEVVAGGLDLAPHQAVVASAA